MTTSPKSTSHQCSFCRNSLTKLPIEPPDWPWLLLLLRPCQCPHCFVVYRRPLNFVSKLPGVKWFASNFNGERKKTKGMLSSSDVGGPVAKFVSQVGRSVQSLEENVSALFSAVFSTIWRCLTWMPDKLMGKKRRKKRSRGKGKFLKSK